MEKVIQDFIDNALGSAKKSIETNGDYKALLYQVYQTENSGYRINTIKANDFMYSDDSKQSLVEQSHIIAHIAKKLGENLICAFILSDAYLSIQEAKPEHLNATSMDQIDYANYVRPSNDPKRQEAIMIIFCDKDGSYVRYFAYNRNGKEIHFDKEIQPASDLSMIGGTFSKLFPNDLK